MTLDEFTSLNIFHTISSIQYDNNELIIINIESEKEQLIIEPGACQAVCQSDP